jgi:chemotaxis protein histidine kinase CheA
LANLVKKKNEFKQELEETKQTLMVFKDKLALEEDKLQASMVLIKKQKEAKKIALASQRREEERLRKVAEEKARIEEEKLLLIKQQEAIYAAQKEEEEKERLALLKKQKEEAEKKRLALLEKKRKEEEERKRLALLKKQQEEERRRLAQVQDEVVELEKLDLLESDQIGDELALFKEDKKKTKKSGFKDLEDWFKVSVGYSTALKNLDEKHYGREALKTTITINPHSYYFFGMTSSLDLNNYESPYYQPDFSYSFGYSDWHMDTFSWNYSNYANNKFSPKDDEDRFNFGKGNWELSYKTKYDDITFTAKGKYVTDTDTKKLYLKAKTVIWDDVMVSAQWKHNINKNQNRLTLSAKTFLYEKFFISGSIYEYFKSDTIGSNDGEYAYSFGWKDSRPFYPSIIYSNYYTPTRWDPDEGPKFHDGTLSIKFNLDF